MLEYTVKRIAAVIPALIGVVTVVFFMLRLIPGDPAAFIGGDNLSEEALAGLRERLGLAEPLAQQYVNYVVGVLQLDFGTSIHTQMAVRTVIADALPVTAFVAVCAMVVGTAISIPLGAMAAYSKYKGRNGVDSGLTGSVMVLDTIPNFWLGLVLTLVFSLYMGWFPISGAMNWGDPGYMASRLILPIVVLSVAQVAAVARVTRTAVLQTLEEDYVRTARSLGESERTLLFRHALPNAALPILTIAGLSMGNIFAGTVIVEAIFSLPGLGTQLLSGIQSRDYPIVQGMILTYAVVFVMLNVITDIIYTRVDPRVRLS